ncbi:hypothetical protein ACFFRR_001940 [Megaselia abdita]
MSDDLLEVVPTRAALLKQSSSFKATVFESRKADNNRPPKQQKPKEESEPEDDDDIFSDRPRKRKPVNKEDDTEFNIKKARHEVINFAISGGGFRNEKHKKKTEIALAVKLGARAPPKVYKNYKQLLQEKKNLKNVREERKKFHQLGKTQTGLASVKCKSKTQKGKDSKKRAPVSNIANHYGVPNPKFKTKKKK